MDDETLPTCHLCLETLPFCECGYDGEDPLEDDFTNDTLTDYGL